MKKCIVLSATFAVAASSYLAFTPNDFEKSAIALEEVEALASGEGGIIYEDAVNTYCIEPYGKTGCRYSPGNICDIGIFCVR